MLDAPGSEEEGRESSPGSTRHASYADLAVTPLGSGRIHRLLAGAVREGGHDLLVLGARRHHEAVTGGVGASCVRTLRAVHVDTLVVKNPESTSDTILVGIDGSKECYAGLRTAIGLAKVFNKRIEAVGVYDPYLHYTLFNGIVKVLSEKAASVFKFKDQEKLHEEIIDTGLAKIYQAHLEVAQQVAQDHGAELTATLLDGKAFEKIRQLAHRRTPWLLVLGRIGVHSAEGMDIGATTENLLRTVPCNVLVSSQTYVPPVDVRAEASVEWTPAAQKKMDRVPSFVRGVATTAILRWATERGHSVITPSVINSAMGDLLPPDAAQAMGYVAEEVAVQLDNLEQGITFVCATCGWSIRDVRPERCSVCDTPGEELERIDRGALEKIGKLEPGAAVVEETFDGQRVAWTEQAKAILRRVPAGYQRRRSKARIEKTARVRGIFTISKDLALDVVEQDLAETSYLTPRGEALAVDVKAEERPDDVHLRARQGSSLQWTDAAWARLGRVPAGFMRQMTQDRIEQHAVQMGRAEVDLLGCEEGISEGRRVMAEMIGSHGYDKVTEKILEQVKTSSRGPARALDATALAAADAVSTREERPAVAPAQEEPGAEGRPSGSGCPVHHARPLAEAEEAAQTAPSVRPGPPPESVTSSGSGCPVHHARPLAEAEEPAQSAPSVRPGPPPESVTSSGSGCPVHHARPLAEAEESAQTAQEEPRAQGRPSGSGCPVHHARPLAEAKEAAQTAPSEHAPSLRESAASPSAGGCPVHGQRGGDAGTTSEAAAMQWTEEATARREQATQRVTEANKFTRERADALAKNVAETRARKYNMQEVAAGFMTKLGKQLGYGHPLSDLTTQHQFEWTPEALARLENVPDFCRELTKWRVEWTAVKKNLGTTITPEIMDVKYDMWGEVSHNIMEQTGPTMPWSEETWARVENIPPFVLGPVLQAVEGNARVWGFDRITHEVLDRVIEHWVETGDFHEGRFGYKA